MRRVIAASVAILVSALLYAGLGYVTHAAAATIALGASVQLSGPLANTGRYYRDGYQFAVDAINKTGGVKIGNTHEQLALKLLDNQSENNLAVRQYVQLVSQDKVNLLLGPFASDSVIAMSATRAADALHRTNANTAQA